VKPNWIPNFVRATGALANCQRRHRQVAGATGMLTLALNSFAARTGVALAAILVTLALAPFAARADQWSPNLTLTATWHDNASNADRAADKISTWQTNADIVANERYGLTGADAVHLGFHLGGDWWPDYRNLMTGAAGVRADWEHKFGLGALAPILSVELAADQVAARETGRRGTSSGVTVALRKRFNDLWKASLRTEFSQMYARSAVYDRDGTQTTLEVSRDLGEVSRLTLSVYHRSGDIVSHATPPRPDIVALAPNRMPVDTFGRPFVAYSIDARTTGGKLAFIRALDQASAVIAGYEVRRTERDALRYVNQLVSVALVHQF
jgi:hypothetical protein